MYDLSHQMSDYFVDIVSYSDKSNYFILFQKAESADVT